MLNAIVRFSLRFRGVIIALVSLFFIWGVYNLQHLKYDVFPDFAPPQATIQVEAPGLSPEQVELLITQPIENAIHGVPGVQSIRSKSSQGVAVIPVVFEYGSDVYRDRQLIAERLSSISNQLPQGIKAPVIAPLTSATSVVLVLGLTSNKQSLMNLRTIADWTIRPRLLAVPGVANTVVFGGEVKQVQIQLHPDKLLQYNIGINDVITLASKATGIRGAGFIDTDNQRLILQTEGQFLKPDEIGNSIILQQNGVPVRLSDIATVKDAPMPPFSAASIMGQPGVLLEVSNQYGANVSEVTQNVEKAIQELRPSLKEQGIHLRSRIFRPANLIETANTNVITSLIIGAILVVGVLFLFLWDMRTAAISCLAIPLSLLTAITVMQQFGLSINTMTLGGLAIAIGEVVDDAVIDVENILRRLKQNKLLANPLPRLQVVLNASLEVRTAVVYATFAVALIFLPILTMSGVAGKLFQPLGIAYILSIMASLLVALTLTPVLCSLLLDSNHLPSEEPFFAQWLKGHYSHFLIHTQQHFRKMLLSVVGITVLGLLLFFFLRIGFLPDLKEGHFIAHSALMPGTSLQESLRFGNQITAELIRLPYVRTVAQRVGRAELSEDTWGTNYSEFDIDLKSLNSKDTELASQAIQKIFANYPYANTTIMSYLSEHIMDTISGHQAAVVVNVFGHDLNVLDNKAKEITQILNGLKKAKEVQFQSLPTTPQLSIRLRDADLVRWGFNATDVMDAVRTAYQGSVITQVAEGNQYFNVSVILDPSFRQDVLDVGNLPLRNANGQFVHLQQLADIVHASGRHDITHEGARRVQTITTDVTDNNIMDFIHKAQKAIYNKVKFPPGTYIEISGTGEATKQSFNDLSLYSGFSAIGILLLLSLVMRSKQNLLLVLMNIPFALVGGVIAAIFCGGILTLGAMVGFITLFGITLRNAIMLMSHYEHLVLEEGHIWNFETALLGASERLLPILMTALVTGLGLLPMALGSGAPGREIEGPLALVILGGLITSTALNLLVLPTFATHFANFKKKDN